MKNKVAKRIFLTASLAIILAVGLNFLRVYKHNNYNYIFYDFCYYIITNETVDVSQIGQEIGQVLRNTEINMLLGNENFDANRLSIGTTVYVLKEPSNFSNAKVLAIQCEDNLYKVAREVIK